MFRLIQNTRYLGIFGLALFFWGIAGLNHNVLAAKTKSANMNNLMLEIEQTLSQVSEQTGAAVVSISSERTTKVGRYFRSFGDDTFDQFLRDFFYGQMPEREYKNIGLGSGVIIDAAGYILTNEHVISKAEKITVTLADGRQFNARIKGADYRSDLAVIKIEAKDLPYANLGDSDKVKTGQWAIAIGNPFGFAVISPKPTITFGVISALHRSLPQTLHRERGYLDLIQTDAAINPGNSGGPLVNINGEVIGINVAIFSAGGGSDGIGFAIPINDAKLILDKLLKGEEILYGWLGIGIQDLNSALAEYFGLTKTEGVLISKVLPGSPAQRAGLKEKDIIVKFDHKKVENTLEFLKMVERSEVDQTTRIKVLRNKLLRDLDVKIGKRPTPEDLELGRIPGQEDKMLEQPSEIPLQQWRGIEVSAITPEIASNFNLETSNGVVVTDVKPDSAAEIAGIVAGDIITQINTIVINNVNDYKRAVYKTQGSALVKTRRGYFVLK